MKLYQRQNRESGDTAAPLQIDDRARGAAGLEVAAAGCGVRNQLESAILRENREDFGRKRTRGTKIS
ncbi:MAG: hypothetical protein AB7G88_09110 [Thermomicrobiales bacterium]